ncbi:MAG TPA: GIY-YIG nuclease family protein [Brevundimonas sp.]|jgi:transposase-like protein|uniref:GIY-YIG nuclease family protein n=1 Tax=Brevundimonas sp. TaxID=1871086 RepID=UPI002E139853|nr:GIY-YIG nuclease family protein [Brevundimonas sp.]
MTKSEQIRALAKQGLSTTEIARRMGVRYQHAYNVLRQAGVSAPAKGRSSTPVLPRAKPSLTVETLVAGGFRPVARWVLEAAILRLDRPVPKERGVYAFVVEGRAMYVGLATMGLAKRLYFYGKPGATQKTSVRLNEVIRQQIASQGPLIEVYVAMPPALEWNGLPVSGDAGLELGLIQTFDLPWNVRSAG